MKEARQYLAAGLSVLPADRERKHPAIPSWKEFQTRLPTEREVDGWFKASDGAVCVICGKVSGNVEVIDFDNHGELFPKWAEAIPQELFDRLVMEQTPSGGFHVAYRCEKEVCGNIKLAVGMRDGKRVTLIETRGEGGLVLCAPTRGYALKQNGYDRLPVLTDNERVTLLQAAYDLNEEAEEEHIAQTVPSQCPQRPAQPSARADFAVRPGDDYNRRGDLRALLLAHGWKFLRKTQDGNEHWQRPGKSGDQNSATLKDSSFYVFSSNAEPFEAGKSYSPFTAYAILEHGGDYTKAASALLAEGYGQSAPKPDRTDGIDWECLAARAHQENPTVHETEPQPPPPAQECFPSEILAKMEAPEDTGEDSLVETIPFPEELYDIPGLVGDVMKTTLRYSNKPNRPLALAGALALMSYLAARKVKSPTGLRPNVYLLALADSGSGKERPRDVNQLILEEIQKDDGLLDRVSSGEGIEDALKAYPALFWMCDEFYSTLQEMMAERKDSKDTMMEYLLKLYTNSHKFIKTRARASLTPVKIRFPHLTLFATTTPDGFFENLREKFLLDGMYARLNVMVAEKAGRGRLPPELEVPQDIIERARLWAHYTPPQTGNLTELPLAVPYTADAAMLAEELFDRQEDECEKARKNEEPQWKISVWNRACETALRYALIYACSIALKPEDTVITAEAVRWGEKFMWWEIRNKFFLTERHYFRTDFERIAESVIEVMRRWHRKNGEDTPMPGWKFNRRTKHLPPNILNAVIESLGKQRRLFFGAWKNGMVYSLHQLK